MSETSSAATANPGHAVGYADASQLTVVPSIFGDVNATSFLMRYTRYGDANLDGLVNLKDFNRLATHSGSTDAFWSYGDFNYDSHVNLADFNLMAQNFGLSANGPTASPDDWAALGAAVPEPTGAAVLLCVLGALIVGARRRRA